MEKKIIQRIMSYFDENKIHYFFMKINGVWSLFSYGTLKDLKERLKQECSKKYLYLPNDKLAKERYLYNEFKSRLIRRVLSNVKILITIHHRDNDEKRMIDFIPNFSSNNKFMNLIKEIEKQSYDTEAFLEDFVIDFDYSFVEEDSLLYKDGEDIYFSCDCGGEVLRLNDYYTNNRLESINFSMLVWPNFCRRGIKERIRHIWKIIRDGHPYDDAICLDRKKVEKLYKKLGKILNNPLIDRN